MWAVGRRWQGDDERREKGSVGRERKGEGKRGKPVSPEGDSRKEYYLDVLTDHVLDRREEADTSFVHLLLSFLVAIGIHHLDVFKAKRPAGSSVVCFKNVESNRQKPDGTTRALEALNYNVMCAAWWGLGDLGETRDDLSRIWRNESTISGNAMWKIHHLKDATEHGQMICSTASRLILHAFGNGLLPHIIRLIILRCGL